MRRYEDITKISENLQKQRSYYIPKGGHVNLNGTWNFKFYECDFEEKYLEKEWKTIDVPSCWQSRGYENPNYRKTVEKDKYGDTWVKFEEYNYINGKKDNQEVTGERQVEMDKNIPEI